MNSASICGYLTLDGVCPRVDCVIHRDLRCDCGRKANAACGSEGTIVGLVLCGKPHCSHNHAACAEHRHAPGTMGYPGAPGKPMVGRAEFQLFAPEAPGLAERLRVFWRNNFWSALKKAIQVWADEKKHFPPPAPLPVMILQIGARKFRCVGDAVVEVPFGHVEEFR